MFGGTNNYHYFYERLAIKPIVKLKKMKAKVNTKSNFRNLNGQWLEVKEIVGTRVSCIVDTEEYGKQTVDFVLSEVTEMDTTDGGHTALHPIFSQALKPFGIR